MRVTENTEVIMWLCSSIGQRSLVLNMPLWRWEIFREAGMKAHFTLDGISENDYLSKRTLRALVW